MNCAILRTLYMKANGEVLCNDDAGERISLGAISEAGATTGIGAILVNEKYEHIRSSLRAGHVPWKEICGRCAFLRPDEPFSRDGLKSRLIEKFQIEASLACALRCPMCANSTQIRSRSGVVHFPPALMRRVLCELRSEGYAVKCIEYCGQGEPLNHPRFRQLVDTCREVYPEARQRLITNGNHLYRQRIGDASLDEIIVSVDGARQESYEQYRIKGKIDKCLQFMADAVESARTNGGRVIWKYILFDTNDSDGEILEAQRLSQELGVTHLLFVHSHTRNKSLRYTAENPFALPIAYPNVTVNSHPSYYRSAVMLHPAPPVLVSGRDALMHVDQVIHARGLYLSFAGWAISGQNIDRIGVDINGVHRGRHLLGIRRPDVLRAHPEYGQTNSGFHFSCKDVPSATGSILVTFTLHGGDGCTIATFVLTLRGPGHTATRPNRSAQDAE